MISLFFHLVHPRKRPGWTERWNGPSMSIVGLGTGVMRTSWTRWWWKGSHLELCRNKSLKKNEVVLRSEVSPDFIPVDVPINLMIVAAWSVAGAASKTKQIPVVQIMMLKADDDDADPHDNLIEGVQLHLQPRQGQDLGRVAAVDSQLAQVGLQSFPSSGSYWYVSHR